MEHSLSFEPETLIEPHHVTFNTEVSIIGTSEQDHTDVDWLQSARDRFRFWRRIQRINVLLQPLILEHCEKINKRCVNTDGNG